MPTSPSDLGRRAAKRFCCFLFALALTLPFVASISALPAAGVLAGPGVPVMGPSTLTGSQIAAWYVSTGHAPHVGVSMAQLAAYYVAEGNAENLRGDLAFAQSIVETGYFGFVGSIVKPSNNNFAGMGACDSCNSGTQFPTPQVGVRAQIQHLKNYADITSRAATLHHPPVVQWYAQKTLSPVTAAYNFDHFFAKGRAPTWNLMGNGNWATAPNYAVAVLQVYNKMLIFNGKPGACPPDGLWIGHAQATQCPAALRSPGRAIAGSPTGGFYSVNGTGRVTAVNAIYYGAAVFGSDIARDIAVMPGGLGYVVLDGYGGVHKFGSAATGAMGALRGPYWPGWDIARSISVTPDGKGFVVLDGWGGLHYAGTATRFASAGSWRGWDIARSIALTPDGHGLYLLDGLGGVHAVGTAANRGSAFFGRDLARDIAVGPDGAGYQILDGFGGIHPRGAISAIRNPGFVSADRYRSLALVPGHAYVDRNDGVNTVF